MIRVAEIDDQYDLPLRRYRCGEYTIEGFSRSAYQTYWRIPELRMGFDIGAQPQTFSKTDQWAISHTHADHLAGLSSYLARRDILGAKPPTIYLPEAMIDDLRDLIAAWQHLQDCDLPCHLVGVKPGDEYPLPHNKLLCAYQTVHTVPSLAYILWDVRQKLDKQYLQTSQKELANLHEGGVEITHEERFPLVGYTGDTTIEAFDLNPDLFLPKILIMECTFMLWDAESRDFAKQFGHIHLADLVERAEEFQNELIILGHFSNRYKREEIIAHAETHLPKRLKERTVLWV